MAAGDGAIFSANEGSVFAAGKDEQSVPMLWSWAFASMLPNAKALQYHLAASVEF